MARAARIDARCCRCVSLRRSGHIWRWSSSFTTVTSPAGMLVCGCRTHSHANIPAPRRSGLGSTCFPLPGSLRSSNWGDTPPSSRRGHGCAVGRSAPLRSGTAAPSTALLAPSPSRGKRGASAEQARRCEAPGVNARDDPQGRVKVPRRGGLASLGSGACRCIVTERHKRGASAEQARLYESVAFPRRFSRAGSALRRAFASRVTNGVEWRCFM